LAIYEFECLKCDKKFEVDQPMISEHISDCPYCKGSNTKRIYNIPHINVISDSDLSARLIGVPKSRLDKAKELRDSREKRQKRPEKESDVLDNSLHPNKKK
jgi:putative FmdB family regulatory protein